MTRLASFRTVMGLASFRCLVVALVGFGFGGVTQADDATLPKLRPEVAFPNVTFERPVALAYPNDGKNLLFVVEQHRGVVQSFTNKADASDKQEFLVLPDPINKGNEEGLLGLAFHPKYAENGEFFVYYSGKDSDGPHSVVSRFHVSKDDPRKADPASEQRVWVSDRDPFPNHNGGCIAFGPDGNLYISLGDSGAADDPRTTGQNPKDFFASILRIDVDHPSDSKPYGIPADNPQVRDPKYAGWAPEVYAIGLRNVWKFSFDRATGTLWAGDVGQNKWEMVHIITNGGNYGWSVVESFHPFRPRQTTDKATTITKPIVEYPHGPGLDAQRDDYGQSITGGYVYRGAKLPNLVGTYVYADFQSGRIWGVRLDNDAKVAVAGQLVDVKAQHPLNIAAFGENAQGDLFLLPFEGKDGRESHLYRLVPTGD